MLNNNFHAWNFFIIFCRLLIFFQRNFFKNTIRESDMIILCMLGNFHDFCHLLIFSPKMFQEYNQSQIC